VTLIKASSGGVFVGLFLLEQVRGYPLIERIFEHFVYLSVDVFVTVLLEKKFGVFVDIGGRFKAAVSAEFDVFAIPQDKPARARVFGKRLGYQFRKLIDGQIPGRKTLAMHRVDILNQDFLPVLREFEDFQQNFGDVICSDCGEVHSWPPRRAIHSSHRLLAAFLLSLNDDFLLIHAPFYISSLNNRQHHAEGLLIIIDWPAGYFRSNRTFFHAQYLAYLKKRLGFFHFHNFRQPNKNRFVVKPMSALCPLRFADQAHRRIIMNRLAREGGVSNDVPDSIQLGGHLNHLTCCLSCSQHQILFLPVLRRGQLK
jgi:hypothetical protein